MPLSLRDAGNHRDDAGLADAGVMLDAERGELLLHDARGPVLLEAELGMGVQITTNGGEFVVPASYGFSRFHSIPTSGRRAARFQEKFSLSSMRNARSMRSRGSTA